LDGRTNGGREKQGSKNEPPCKNAGI